MFENECRRMVIGRIERHCAGLVELEPIVELVENDGARGRRRRRPVGLKQRRIPTRPIDAPPLAGGVLPALQATDEGTVARRTHRLQPGLEVRRVVGPGHAPPALAGGEPFRKMIENEWAKGSPAARIEPWPPKPGQAGK